MGAYNVCAGSRDKEDKEMFKDLYREQKSEPEKERISITEDSYLEHDWEDKIEKVNHEDIANQTFDNLMELSLEWEQKMRKVRFFKIAINESLYIQKYE